MDTILLYAVAIILFAVSFVKDKKKTAMAVKKGLKAIENILPQFLVVLVIIAAALAVFNPQTISRVIGTESEILGVLTALIVGAITLIPGFVAFQAASELLSAGAGVLQIATFVSALMMVGIVTLPMEISYYGKRAALMRNGLALLFSLLAAVFVTWVVSL